MWLKLPLLLITLTVSCNGLKNTSCDFNHYFDTCNWRLFGNENCIWKVNSGILDGNKGYLRLKGANQCSSNLVQTFSWSDDSSINFLTFDYYVKGIGPFKLSVSHNNRPKPDWSCAIQMGSEKRTAHLVVPGDASSIKIEGKVAEGSDIIITQIWNDAARTLFDMEPKGGQFSQNRVTHSTNCFTKSLDGNNLLGQKSLRVCPLLPTTPGPTTTTKLSPVSHIRPLASTTTRISENSVQSTVATATAANPELTSNNVRSRRQIETEQTKKKITWGVVGGLGVIIAIVIVVIVFIMRRRKQTAYEVNELPETLGKSVPYENLAE